ncbi:tail fiber domain-containing protein [Flavobacterium sp. UW10123]|uniref:tail fiber domain-containing protein n=1 Tax=Flavobacterium sp. UW10123 TaxID=3230800 RepID=UPI0033955C93
MKKIICMLLLLQGGFIIAQTETVPTINGKKIQIAPNAGTADNGLTATNGKIQLGGSLTQPTTITTTSVNTLTIANLQTGALTDQYLTTDASGVVRKIANTNWNTTGNTGTTPGTNFIGTKDDQDLVFKRNNTESGKIAVNNTSFGINALASNTGNYSVAFGSRALFRNTIGAGLVAIGSDALLYNTTGSNSIAIGYNCLQSNTTGSNNVSIGMQSMLLNTTGNSNVSIGVSTMSQNSSGSYNVAIGDAAMGKNISGKFNTALGSSSLDLLNSGDSNIAFGNNAGSYFGVNSGLGDIKFLAAANNSIFIGANTRALANNSVNEIVIGSNVIGKGSNTVTVGDANMISIGGYTAWSNYSDQRLKKDIVSSTYGLNFINKLRPVTYHMKTGTTDLQTGFIAQEVEAAANGIGYKFSGVVKPTNENDYYSLRYSEFVVPLVKAVQEQQTQIESLQKELNDLKAVVQQLVNKN